MKRLVGHIAAVLAVAAVGLQGQGAGGSVVERVDPALDAVIAADAKLELLKEDYFGFLEGPVWVPEQKGGYLLFSDIAANRIYKWSQDGQLSVFLERSGFTGTDASSAGLQLNNGRLEIILLGSNGLTLDSEGRVVFGTHGDRALKRREKDGSITVLADRFEGKRFSGPNDLVYRSDGALYFSDVAAGLRGGAKSPLRELDFFGLYLLKDGKLQVVERNPENGGSNGVALSPDDKHLYASAGPKIVRYDVQPDGMLANRIVFFDMSPGGPGGSDGLKVDRSGNVYSTGPGGVWIISPQGKHLGRIRVPTTNMAFGGADGKMLYLVSRGNLGRIPMKVAGVRPMPKGAR